MSREYPNNALVNATVSITNFFHEKTMLSHRADPRGGSVVFNPENLLAPHSIRVSGDWLWQPHPKQPASLDRNRPSVLMFGAIAKANYKSR